MTLTEAVTFWCDSSVEALKLARQFRKVDGQNDPMALLQSLKDIADVVKKLNDAQVAEVESLQENPDGSFYSSHDTAVILKGIINDFRSVPIKEYLSNVNLIKRAGFQDVVHTGHGWIRTDWAHMTALDFFKMNIQRGVEKQPFLKDLLKKLKLDLGEMLSFGMGSLVAASNGESTDDAVMGKVFGDYLKDKSRIQEAAETMANGERRQCTGSWSRKLQCKATGAGHWLKNSLIDPIKECMEIGFAECTAHNVHMSSSSLAQNSDDESDENLEESDEDESASHALALADDEGSEFKIGAGLTPAGIAACNGWCFGIVAKYHVVGLLLPPFWTIIAIATWIINVLLPSLVIAVGIIGAGAVAAGLFLAAVLVTAPVWLAVLGMYAVSR
jgi:hypothetical protein